jgi:hypothetical protein
MWIHITFVTEFQLIPVQRKEEEENKGIDRLVIIHGHINCIKPVIG